jgi:hypothetical protein
LSEGWGEKIGVVPAKSRYAGTEKWPHNGLGPRPGLAVSNKRYAGKQSLKFHEPTSDQTLKHQTYSHLSRIRTGGPNEFA